MTSALRRRTAALCAVLGVAALTTAAPGGGGPAGADAIGPASAAAADCVPVQRTKTVVKRVRVKRHGRVVTVKRKRKKHWTVCVPATDPAPPKTCAVPSSTLGVTTEDVSGSAYILSRDCVTAGDVTVQLNNTEAMDPHNLFLRRADSGSTTPAYRLPDTDPFEVPPGGIATETFNLTAGDWYLWCDLLLHEEQGMSAHLTVG